VPAGGHLKGERRRELTEDGSWTKGGERFRVWHVQFWLKASERGSGGVKGCRWPLRMVSVLQGSVGKTGRFKGEPSGYGTRGGGREGGSNEDARARTVWRIRWEIGGIRIGGLRQAGLPKLGPKMSKGRHKTGYPSPDGQYKKKGGNKRRAGRALTSRVGPLGVCSGQGERTGGGGGVGGELRRKISVGTSQETRNFSVQGREKSKTNQGRGGFRQVGGGSRKLKGDTLPNSGRT